MIIAFLILAAYTYTSGLQAPALIALVKDMMVLTVMLVTIIYIPPRLGGFRQIFAAVHQQALQNPKFSEILTAIARRRTQPLPPYPGKNETGGEV